MLKGYRFLIVVATFILTAAPAGKSRAECYCRELDLFCWPSWCYTCCPDIYCPKPMPPVPCSLGGTLPRLLPVGPAGDADDEPADANAHANKWTARESSDAVCANESSNR